MSLSDAVKSLPDGVRIELDVSPGAKQFQIQRYNQWRGRIEVKVVSPAQRGRANEELLREFARLFNVPTGSVSLLSGSTSSKKTIKISHVSIDAVLETLKEMVGDG
jgi:hypothetical protein